MSRLYLVRDADEVVRRRKALPSGTLVEAWPDLALLGCVWLGSESKTALDALGEPLAALLSVEARGISVYYGPWLSDLEALPSEESVRTRVVSAHGIAVAWVTRDQFGERTGYQPRTPGDPIFALRRPRMTVSHLWRLFTTRREAQVYLREFYANDPQAQHWAEHLEVANYTELVERHGRPEGDATA